MKGDFNERAACTPRCGSTIASLKSTVSEACKQLAAWTQRCPKLLLLKDKTLRARAKHITYASGTLEAFARRRSTKNSTGQSME
eukprot:2379382-Amphidinium_carterae.1